MFENYQNINTQYTPNNYQDVFGGNGANDSLQPATPNKPFEVKDRFGNVTGYFWYYKDSVVLSFEIEGEYVAEGNDTYYDVDDVLSGCNATLTIYDTIRYNIIDQITLPASKCIDFTIAGELSEKMIKGKYNVSLIISNDDLNYRETVFGSGTCIFEVR